MKFLFKNGMNPNMTDSHGQTALFYAVRKSSYELIDWMVSNGAEVLIKDKHGKSILQHVPSNHADKSEIKDLLRSKGA